MKLDYEVPDKEGSKLRLIRELPYSLQMHVRMIFRKADNWQDAIKKVDLFILAHIVHLRNVNTLFNSKSPVGEQRKSKRV